LGLLLGCDGQFPDVPIAGVVVGLGLSNDLIPLPIGGLGDDQEVNPLAPL
jgi:hypothetical protein